MNSKPKSKTRARRPRLNAYRVWFRDGTSVVMRAEYPHKVRDNLPVEIAMKIDRIVDDVE